MTAQHLFENFVKRENEMPRNFAIIDCETTGFGTLDRVLEIAVVVLNGQSLETIDEFDTLVNPMRDVGRTDIHGIKPSMISAAPAFEEVIAGIAQRLDGAVLVGHNLAFDQRFLAQECAKAQTPFDAGHGVCTYRLTKQKLASAAARFGIKLEGHHRALVDARATAELLRRILDTDSDHLPVSMPMPSSTRAARTHRREATGWNASEGTTSPLKRLLSKACFPSSLDACIAYFEMLDWVLADGELSEEERDLLSAQIAHLGLTPAQVKGMHEAYLRSIIAAVERDRLVSNAERHLLESIAHILGLDSAKLPTPTPMVHESTSRSTKESDVAIETLSAHPLPRSARVCFTGTAVDADGREFTRERLEQIAAAHGFQPVGSVSKKGCDLLVAADPTSNSGKAQKARQLGIPTLSVEEFIKLTVLRLEH